MPTIPPISSINCHSKMIKIHVQSCAANRNILTVRSESSLDTLFHAKWAQFNVNVVITLLYYFHCTAAVGLEESELGGGTSEKLKEVERNLIQNLIRNENEKWREFLFIQEISKERHKKWCIWNELVSS